jgi:hypothetical protein
MDVIKRMQMRFQRFDVAGMEVNAEAPEAMMRLS